MRDRARDNWQWALALAIFALGLLPLLWLWNLTEGTGWRDIVAVIAWFYPLVMILILPLVKWYWPGAQQEREEYHRRLFTE